MNFFQLIYADDAFSLACLIAIFYIVGRNMARGKAELWGRRAAGVAYMSFVVYAVDNVSPLGASQLAYIAFRGLFAAGLAMGTAWMVFAVVLFLHQQVQIPESRVRPMSLEKQPRTEPKAQDTVDPNAPTQWKPNVRDWSKLPAEEFRKFDERCDQIQTFEKEARALLVLLRKPLEPPSPPLGAWQRRRLKTQIEELELARQFFSGSGDDPQYVGRVLAECDSKIVDLKRAIGEIPPDKEEPPQLAGIAVLDEAIARKPKNPLLYVECAKEFICQRLFQKAIDDCNYALRLLPGYYAALNMRGIARHHLRKFGAAIRDFERSIYENPKYGWAYASLAAVYNATGAYREAIGPAYFASQYNLAGVQYLALAYERLAEHENAVHYLTQLIQLDPDGQYAPDARVRRAKQLLKLGRTELAMHDLKTHLVRQADPGAKQLLAQLQGLPDFNRLATVKTSQEEKEAEEAADQLNRVDV